MKAKILRQIRALEADLKAIERVEQINKDLADQRDDAPEQDGRSTLIGTVGRVLDDEWTPVSVYLGRVQAEHPKASRTAVSTALQRLANRGVAEARGSKKDGYDYRRRQPLVAVSQERTM